MFPRFGRAGFLALLCGLIGVSTHTFVGLSDVHKRIRYRIPENTIWAAAQAEIELSRLLSMVAPVAHGAGVEAAGPVRLQFDVTWSRAGLFSAGVIGDELARLPEAMDAYLAYRKALEVADAYLAAVEKGDAAAARKMLETLTPHREAIRALTMASLQNDRRVREKLSADYELLEEQFARFGPAAVVLLVFLLAFFYHSERRSRRLLADTGEARTKLEEARARSQLQAEHMELLARKAQTASSAKSEFLAMMSHDIRTPLNAIMGLAELLQDSRLDAEQKRMTTTILRASEGLLTLINDILDLTRLEAGKLPLAPVSFSPAELAREVIDVVEVLAVQNGNAMSLELDPALPAAVVGDRDRIRQILLNLTGNANKFTRAGSVVLSVGLGRVEGDTASIRFAVRDTGRGIAPELRRRLFRPFEQGEDARDVRGGSTGLGLAISDRLVRLMGGSIEVVSQPGEGSEFSFEIGLERCREAPAAEAAPQSLQLDLAGKRVLVADDAAANLMVASRMFASFGAVVETAECGISAIAKGSATSFDIVVLDSQMPGTDGVGAMRELRRAGASRNALFVSLTAQSMRRDRERLLEAGFDIYLSKPVRKADIAQALGAHANAAPAPPSAPQEQIDTEILGEMAEDVGAETLRVLVNQVHNEAETCLEILRASARNGDGEAARKAAHKIRGLLAQFGLERASGEAGRIEDGSRPFDDEAVVDALGEAARSGLAALRAHIANYSGPSASGRDAA